MASDASHNVPYVIRSRRIMLGLSQARLAEMVGRTATTVRRWERGEVSPPDDVVERLAAALEVDAGELRPPPPPKRSSVVVSGGGTPTPPSRLPRDAPDGPAAGDSTRPQAASPVTRLQRKSPAPPAPGKPKPAAPAADTTTDAPAGEPWIQFEPEPAPPPAAAAAARSADATADAPAAARAPAAAPPPAPVATATAARQSAPAVQVDDLDATAAVPPPRRPVARAPVVTRSYLEDPKQRLLYSLRLILTLAALGVMAVVAVWALGELLGALDETLDFFSDTTVVDNGLDLPSLPGAES